MVVAALDVLGRVTQVSWRPVVEVGGVVLGQRDRVDGGVEATRRVQCVGELDPLLVPRGLLGGAETQWQVEIGAEWGSFPWNQL